MEHCYKHIMISLHGGTCSYFDKTREEVVPFIKENVLNSLQVLSIPPRNCVNWTSSEILDNVVLDCYHLYKRYIPSGKTKGFLEKIGGVPLDKKIKKIIKRAYENNDFSEYFKNGYENNEELSIIPKTTEPENVAGFLTTYFWEKDSPYYINNYSTELKEDGFSNGVVIMKDTNYYLAPNFYQKDGPGFRLLNLTPCSQRDHVLSLCEDDFIKNKTGKEYYVEDVSLYNVHFNKISQTIKLVKIFIENDTQRVYIKQLAGYNFLSSPMFIEYIKYYRELDEDYNFKDIYGNIYKFNYTNKDKTEMANSLSIPLLKEIYPINKTTIIDKEVMLTIIFNFELINWFENDGYLCYQGFFCRNMDIVNMSDVKDYYEELKCGNDKKCKNILRNIPLSPRKIRKHSKKVKKSSDKGWIPFLKKLVIKSSRKMASSSSSSSRSSRSHSSNGHSSKGHSSKNRPHSRNRRVLNAFGGKNK